MKDWLDCILIAALTLMLLAVAYFAYTSNDTSEKASIRGQVEISEQVTGMATKIIESNNGLVVKILIIGGVVFLITLKIILGVFERTRPGAGAETGYIEGKAGEAVEYITYQIDNNQYLK